MRRPAVRSTLTALLAFVAVNAVAGGIYAISGAPGVPKEWLAQSPFESYLVPGLILLVVVGGSLLLAAVATLAAWPRARLATSAAAAILFGWIGVQVSIIGYVSFLQPAMALVAVLILVLAGC